MKYFFFGKKSTSKIMSLLKYCGSLNIKDQIAVGGSSDYILVGQINICAFIN
jgi:hypothetical protein